jgi:hypothetical protein
MATTFSQTPIWTDNVSVVAATTVAAGSATRGTVDLRGKPGAQLLAWIGRKGATAPASGIVVEARRVLNNATPTVGGVTGTTIPFTSQTVASNATTVNADSTTAGTFPATVGVASATGIVAGDLLCLYDAGFTRLEFARVSKISGTTVTFDGSLQFQHTAAQADNVTRVADRFSTWLPGGSLYEVVFDYGASATGSDVVVLAKAQTYDSDQSIQTA